MTMPLGYLSLVLHAHLPFVRHPEHADFLEEDWFFEAVSETYAPLLMKLENLREQQIPFRLTLVVTPTLASMMEDVLLSERLERYVDRKISLLTQETRRVSHLHVHYLARQYLAEFSDIKSFIFERYHGWLLDSVRSLMTSGHLDVITCTATHGFLPLMNSDSAMRNQIKTAVDAHKKFFGRASRGIWLAECGYTPDIDSMLVENGIEYTFVDSHGLLFGEPEPVFGVYAPVITKSGLNVFGRDQESSRQVWSQKEGYPGDTNYREFHRDLGYDADYDYIKQYLHSDGVRRGVGIKYHKITGSTDLSQKEYYDPVQATERAAIHAGNFLFNRQAQLRALTGKTHNPPIIVAPYDAELFGHWWYEGPQFLDFLIRKIAFDQTELKLTTCADYLDRYPIRQLQTPNPSTWGSEGYNTVWLNGGNAWVYRHQHWAEHKMDELSSRFPRPEGKLKRALKQLKRELLLLQSSDWAFIMTTGTTVPYATRRFREHIDRFLKICSQIETNSIDNQFLSDLEKQDMIFPDIDFESSRAVKA